MVYTQIVGSSRADKISTGSGDTLVFAGAGDDSVLAGAGDDWIFAGRGRDTVYGRAGNDTIVGEDGADRLYGEEGADWIFGGEDDDTISGGGGDDLLLGGSDDDTVSGGGGNDILCGGKGRDCLDGGTGDDIFRLGAKSGDDNDVYNGGSGRDLFLLVAEFDRDVIQNFSIAQGDRLAISDLDEVAELGRYAFTMERSSRDADDLMITCRGLPRVHGVVRSVSADRIVDEATGQAYYLARVEVPREELATLDKGMVLVPGMPAEVLIVTAEQTAFDYLIEPFRAAFRRGFRES